MRDQCLKFAGALRLEAPIRRSIRESSVNCYLNENYKYQEA